MIPHDNPPTSKVMDLEAALGDTLSIHDVTDRGDVVVFRGRYQRSPELLYEQVSPRFKALGYQTVLRQDKGLDVVIGYPTQAAGRRSSPWLHLTLFLLTVLSTGFAGTLQWLGDHGAEVGLDPTAQPGLAELARLALTHWRGGLPFTVALLGILGVHEFGHYFMARRYKLDVSLPYFIPFPLNYIGTLGAVIKIQSPFESRRALFDVGIAGPLAGLAVAVPVVVMGLAHAQMIPIDPASTLDSVREPLLFQLLVYVFRGPRPHGQDLLMNPLLWAGWWGFVMTAINLAPISQLDGGHIAYGLIGTEHRALARIFFVGATMLAIVTDSRYLVLMILVLLMGLDHPPAMDDLTPIGMPRRILGWATLILFFFLFAPVPF